MKLQYQLNIAFTTLLIVIMAVTGFVIYSLLLNMLIQDEERQLEQKGELLVRFLNEEHGGRRDITAFSQFLEEQDLQLILYDRNQNHVFFSTMPIETVRGFAEDNYFTTNQDGLWEYKNSKFVTSKKVFYPESMGLELILLTPLTDLQIVQQRFISRLFVVFLVGAIAAVLLSYFLTKKLATPLSRLKLQLKKIENRQFDEIERIKATGEIKEVEQSIYEMAKELERYMRSQQTFFQNASHELKTPLMTIQGYAEGIRDRVFHVEEEEKNLEIMIDEVKRLKKIINEMILLAKLDSEQTVYEPKLVNVDELINQTSSRLIPLAKEKNITLDIRVEKKLSLFVDEEKVLRALLNIGMNGIRYAESLVQISAFQNGSNINICIEDDGPGVSKDIMPQIFHRFVKGKSGETGLGLAIARAIVEQSGGTISVGASEFGGAKFIITFKKEKNE